MTDRHGIDSYFVSAARSATDDIARAVENVARRFIACGGYGSLHMHLASNETIVQAFKSAVIQMTAEAKRHDNHDMVRGLLDSHLSQVIDLTLADHTARLRTANAAPDDSAALCAYLHQGLKRVKDAAIRDIALLRRSSLFRTG